VTSGGSSSTWKNLPWTPDCKFSPTCVISPFIFQYCPVTLSSSVVAGKGGLAYITVFAVETHVTLSQGGSNGSVASSFVLLPREDFVVAPVNSNNSSLSAPTDDSSVAKMQDPSSGIHRDLVSSHFNNL
jgi:hypothetical protein